MAVQRAASEINGRGTGDLLRAEEGMAPLRGLARELKAGRVRTLLVLGGNPAYDAPADLDFAAATRLAKRVIHSGTHRDETAAQAQLHLPQPHMLESWGDFLQADGTRLLQQPVAAPAEEALSEIELLALLLGEEPDGRALVRQTHAEISDDEWLRLLAAGGGKTAAAGRAAQTSPPPRDGGEEDLRVSTPAQRAGVEGGRDEGGTQAAGVKGRSP